MHCSLGSRGQGGPGAQEAAWLCGDETGNELIRSCGALSKVPPHCHVSRVTCHVSRAMCRCWASSGASAAATSCRCPAGRRSCSTLAPTAGSCPPTATTAGAARAAGPSPGWTLTHGTRTEQKYLHQAENIYSIPRSLSTWVAVGDVDEVNSQLPSPHVEMIKVGDSFIIQTNPNCCKLQVIHELPTNDRVRISQVRQRLVSSCQVSVSSCPAQTQEAQYAQKKYSQSCIFKAYIFTS